jgi:hypothetical protein
MNCGEWPANAFELFWFRYPKKVAKKTARLALFKVMKSGEVEFDKLIEAVDNFARLVRGKDPQYIPHPATWLNAGRWDDEIEVAPVVNDFTWKALRGTHVSKYQ